MKADESARAKQFWDERYRTSDMLWSGNPNFSLVAEAEALPVGRALDIGCGEGADAIWLASLGWDVTGIDISAEAVKRANQRASKAGLETSLFCGAIDSPAVLKKIASDFDLVSVHFLRLPTDSLNAGERLLLNFVKPGGRLIFVEHAQWSNPAHSDYVSAESLLSSIGENWTVVRNEVVERPATSSGAGSHHHSDRVLVLECTTSP